MTIVQLKALIALLVIGSMFSVMAADTKPKDTSKPTFIRVTTQTLSELLFTSTYSAPATVVSLNDSNISAEIQARAIKINATVGERINKGSLLVELDCRNYINTKKQAEAALNLSKIKRDLAKKQLTRNTRLFQRGALPRESLDLAESEVLSSSADIALKQTSIESANIAISKCKIYAPFNGQVTQKQVQQGQIVSPGTSLIRLLETDTLEVEAELSPPELDKARESKQLRFVTRDQSRDVTLRTVIQQLNSASNTQRIRLKIDSDVNIIAGLNGRLEWQDNARKIPPEYMVRRDDALGIMLEDDGVARFHPLKDAKEGQPATVNLLSSSKVIIVNRYSAQDGQAVAID